MSRFTLTAVLLSCVFLMGVHSCCGETPDDVPDEGSECGLGDAGVGATTVTLELTDAANADTASWASGGDAELYFGPQGGWMLVPTVRLSGAGLPAQGCLFVSIDATVAGTPSASLTRSATFRTVGGALESEPFYLLLGNNADELVGREATLTVSADGAGLSGTATLSVVLVNDL